MSLAPLVPDELTAALTAYRHTFGHPVPSEVIRLFSVRTGPLLMEIRQAIALGKPVPAWLTRSRTPDSAAFPEWNDGSHAGHLADQGGSRK
jgi:hypothetical protein